MKTLFRYSIVSLLLISLIVSTVGIAVSMHVCHVSDGTSFVIGFDAQNTTCAACEEEHSDKSCDMPGGLEDDMCCDEPQEEAATACDFNGGSHHDCCTEYTQQISASYDAIVAKSTVSFVKFVFSVFVLSFSDTFQVEKAINCFSVKSGGLSPPYEFDYIHFISSILE